MATQAATRLVSIDEFVSGLRKFHEQAFEGTKEILRFLETTPVGPETLKPYLTWDRQHYTRNLIDKTEFYELMAICWDVGQVSSVHNHQDQNCWMTVPIGKLMVENFHLVCQDIDAGTCKLETAETVEMNPEHPCAVDPDDPVHRVYNPRYLNQQAVSLHIYSRPFDSCVVYSPEQGTCGQIQLHYTTESGKSKS